MGIHIGAQYYTCAEGDAADEAAEASTPHRLIPKHIWKYVLKFAWCSFVRAVTAFPMCPESMLVKWLRDDFNAPCAEALWQKSFGGN